jgi:hypothetical protein
MVHCGIVTTYTPPFEIVRSTRDFHEVERIPYRREWHRDVLGSVTVNNIDNLVSGPF